MYKCTSYMRYSTVLTDVIEAFLTSCYTYDIFVVLWLYDEFTVLYDVRVLYYYDVWVTRTVKMMYTKQALVLLFSVSNYYCRMSEISCPAEVGPEDVLSTVYPAFLHHFVVLSTERCTVHYEVSCIDIVCHNMHRVAPISVRFGLYPSWKKQSFFRKKASNPPKSLAYM
jgi:hypothetical protein